MAFSPLFRLPTPSFFSPKRFPLAILAGVALLAAGCHPAPPPAPPRVTDPKDPKFIVAEKGDWTVTRAELDKQIAGFLQQNHATPEMVGPRMPMVETKMLDNIVLKKLLLEKAATMKIDDTTEAKDEADQLAQAKGPDTDEAFAAKLKAAGLTLDDLKKLIHDKLLITKVLDSEVTQVPDPSEQEIDKIYDENKEHFATPEKVRASRILVHLDDKMTPAEKAAKKKKIDLAHAKVVKGADFSKVAMEMSEDAGSAPKGGDLNYFQRGENEPQFDEIAFTAKDGTVTAVFETPLGYQFLKITGKQAAGVVPLAGVRTFITQRLKEMKKGQAQQAYGQKLLADSGVTFHLVRVEAPPRPTGPAGPQPAPGEAPPSTPPPDSASTPPPSAPAPEAPAAPPAPEPAPAPASTNAAPQ